MLPWHEYHVQRTLYREAERLVENLTAVLKDYLRQPLILPLASGLNVLFSV